MTVKAADYDITIQQGATFDRTLTWKNPDATLVNLTGYTARMKIRENKEKATSLLDLTTENGRITLGGTAGTIRLLIAAADTAALTKSGVYDLELVSGAGVVTRLLQGSVKLDKEVTR